jgi:hypothetical protein
MCVLRASGRDFDVDAFLAASSWEPTAVHRRGEHRHPVFRKRLGTFYEDAGFNVVVSEAGPGDMDAQVADAELFLDEHADELRRLMSAPGLEGAVLDFPVALRIGDGLTTFAGVIVFTGLTVYDTAKLKAMGAEGLEGEAQTKRALHGALILYLDFINLFLYLLRVLGRRR